MEKVNYSQTPPDKWDNGKKKITKAEKRETIKGSFCILKKKRFKQSKVNSTYILDEDKSEQSISASS